MYGEHKKGGRFLAWNGKIGGNILEKKLEIGKRFMEILYPKNCNRENPNIL